LPQLLKPPLTYLFHEILDYLSIDHLLNYYTENYNTPYKFHPPRKSEDPQDDYTPYFPLPQYNTDSDRNNKALIHKTLTLQHKTPHHQSESPSGFLHPHHTNSR
jgi:hypothetical protein